MSSANGGADHEHDDGLFHGPELDEAMTDAPRLDEIGVCETALHSRRADFVDGQLDELVNEQSRAETRKLLMDAGLPFHDKAVDAFQLRGVIGGSLTYGMAVGMALERMRHEGSRSE